MKKLMMIALVAVAVASNVKADSMIELGNDCDANAAEQTVVNAELANAFAVMKIQGFEATKPLIKQVLQHEKKTLEGAKALLARGKALYRVNHSTSLKQALVDLENELVGEQNAFDSLSAQVNS